MQKWGADRTHPPDGLKFTIRYHDSSKPVKSIAVFFHTLGQRAVPTQNTHSRKCIIRCSLVNVLFQDVLRERYSTRKQKFGTKERGGGVLTSAQPIPSRFCMSQHSHMGIWKRTLIFSQPPLGSSSVSDIHSSVVETGDCLDLVSFVQQASENESVPLVSVCPSVTYFIVSKLPSS